MGRQASHERIFMLLHVNADASASPGVNMTSTRLRTGV